MRYLKLFLSALVLAGLMCTAVLAEGEAVKVYLGKEELEFDVEPQIIGEYTYVPLRAVFDGIGADVDYEAETKTITAVKGETTVIMTVGSTTETINGEENEIAVAPIIVPIDDKTGRTLVPARYAVEAFGYTVSWDGETKTVTITEGTDEESEAETDPEAEIVEAVSEETTVITVKGEYTYTGSVNETGQLNGNGTLVYESGDRYEGDFVNGVKEGTGTYTFASGNVYEGEWKNDERHGTGTMTWYKTNENGEKMVDYEYTGDWDSGNISGTGTMTFYDESGSTKTLEGTWENNTYIGESSSGEAA